MQWYATRSSIGQAFEVAKGALTAKARVAQALAAEETQLARLADALEKQNEDIGKLQTKLADAKAREKAMVARHKTASARLKVRTKLYDERIADAFSRFEQVERTLDEAGLTNPHVREYVAHWANITGAERIEVVSAADDARLIQEALDAGELLPAGEGRYYSRSYYKDTARAE